MRLSIIIPVYNVEKHLGKCIDSIQSALSQIDSDEYEIILVNDGSKDSSGEICDKYAMAFENISVVHKDNGGVSEARNDGIRLAKGEFITFIDSDDFVNHSLLDAFKLINPEADIDVYQFGYTRFNQQKVIKEKNHKADREVDLSGKKVTDDVTLIAAVWNKIYKRDLIVGNNIFFTKGRTNGEDVEFNVNVWLHSKKVFLSKTNYYMYLCERDGSNMNSYSLQHFSNQLLPVLSLCWSKDLTPLLRNFVIAHMYNGVIKVVKAIDKKEFNELIALLKANKHLLRFPKSLPITGKAFWFCTKTLGIRTSVRLLGLLSPLF